MIRYDYKKPQTIEEAIDLLSLYGAKATLIAGGTDVLINMRNRKITPEVWYPFAESRNYNISAKTGIITSAP